MPIVTPPVPCPSSVPASDFTSASLDNTSVKLHQSGSLSLAPFSHQTCTLGSNCIEDFRPRDYSECPLPPFLHLVLCYPSFRCRLQLQLLQKAFVGLLRQDEGPCPRAHNGPALPNQASWPSVPLANVHTVFPLPPIYSLPCLMQRLT